MNNKTVIINKRVSNIELLTLTGSTDIKPVLNNFKKTIFDILDKRLNKKYTSDITCGFDSIASTHIISMEIIFKAALTVEDKKVISNSEIFNCGKISIS